VPRSLFFKLLGAFALVIFVFAGTMIILTGRTTAGQFRLYSDRSGRIWAEQLAPVLAGYYAQAGSWDGLVADVPPLLTLPGAGMGMGGQGMGGMHAAGGTGNGGMWAMMGQRLLVADKAGRVVADSGGMLDGKALSGPELTAGVPIMWNGQQVGTVLVVAEELAGSGTPADAFLSAVNRSTLLAVLAAAIMALALGAVLFFQITSPIRRLRAAAHAIAAGNLTERVPVRSRDELGELAHAFNTMAANLDAAEAQRRQMVADVAHELRTPLSVMQANLEAMQDGVLPLDVAQIASLHEETLLLSRLVSDLRLISLAEAGQLRLESAEVDPAELVRKAVERMGPAAEEKGIHLEVALTGPGGQLPRVQADSDRISQVLANLLNNALRYTPARGTVTVEARRDIGPANSGRVVVAVTDSGPGIAATDLPHVFDRFYRGDRSRARISGGSGLGLAIVKHLVRAHGGVAWAESPVFTLADGAGYGTRISFTLPVAAG